MCSLLWISLYTDENRILRHARAVVRLNTRRKPGPFLAVAFIALQVRSSSLRGVRVSEIDEVFEPLRSTRAQYACKHICYIITKQHTIIVAIKIKETRQYVWTILYLQVSSKPLE